MKSLSPDRRKVIDTLLDRLAPYEPERVILFGSYARNESDELSDVDLVIIKDTTEDFFSRLRSVLRLLDVNRALDILVYTPTEFEIMKQRGNALIETVLEEGIVLYG